MGIYKPGRPRKYVPATKSGRTPPKEPGMYRIRNTRGVILYIGETCNLARRIQEHIRSGKISVSRKTPSTVEYKVADRRSSSYTRRLHEQKKIAKHKPPDSLGNVRRLFFGKSALRGGQKSAILEKTTVPDKKGGFHGD